MVPGQNRLVMVPFLRRSDHFRPLLPRIALHFPENPTGHRRSQTPQAGIEGNGGMMEL